MDDGRGALSDRGVAEVRYPTNSYVFVRYFDDAWPVSETAREVREKCDAAPTSESWISITGAGEGHYLVDVRAGDVIALETAPLDEEADPAAVYGGEFPS